MGKNTITNIMKASVAGTNLRESEKKKSLRIIVREKQQSGS